MHERSVFRTTWFWFGAVEALIAAAEFGYGGHAVWSLATFSFLCFCLAGEQVARQKAEDRAPHRSIDWRDLKRAVHANMADHDFAELDYALDLAWASVARKKAD